MSNPPYPHNRAACHGPEFCPLCQYHDEELARQRQSDPGGIAHYYPDRPRAALPPILPPESKDPSGYAFQLGKRAGAAGQADLKALIKAHGKHGRSIWARSFAAGHAKGLLRFRGRS